MEGVHVVGLGLGTRSSHSGAQGQSLGKGLRMKSPRS